MNRALKFRHKLWGVAVRNFGMYWLRVNQPPPLEAFVVPDAGVKQ